jgi:predicted nucleic acid-binding protein
VILLDTNVVSELMLPEPDGKVASWFIVNADEAALTSVVIGELAYGIAKLPDGRRRSRLEAQLAEWRGRFVDRTYAFGVTAAMIYGELQGAAFRTGKGIAVPDAQIAAIALEHGAMVATRDIADFEGRGIALVNPWAETS